MDLRSRIVKYYREDPEFPFHRVGEVDFSGPTYQIQVIDKKEDEFWPFLQFDAEGRLHDCLCSCESVGSDHGCIHLAVALDYLFAGGELPLHERFARSLWNQLCQIYADRQGDDLSIFHRLKRGHYVCESVTGKRLFSVAALGEEESDHLERLIEKRVAQTEENSLKFFGLSHEEIARWREGRPSDHLRYELSFWADLAKWLFALEPKGYEIRFDYGAGGLPNGIHLHFAELDLFFYISEANLPLLIPQLASVHSPLKVHNFQDEAIERVVYNRREEQLIVIPKKGVSLEVGLGEEEQLLLKRGAIEIGNWLFIPGDGFTSRERHSLLLKPIATRQEIGSFLDEHAQTIAHHLENERIYLERRDLSYEIAFDGDWNLHLKSYLFQPGDIVEGESRDYGSWIYLEEDGFYPVRARLFDGAERTIPEKEVSLFIHQSRGWLNSIPGFHTYLSTIESHFSYRVDEEGALHFKSHLDLRGEEEGAKDFGDWVYLPGQGFFSKLVVRRGAPIADGVVVPARELSLFLRSHRDELDLIDGLFAPTCPVVGAWLRLTIEGQDQLLVEPEYRLERGVKREAIRFFDEWVYVDGEGFSLMPGEIRLPSRFRQPLLLEGKELELFLRYEMSQLSSLFSSVDPRLEVSSTLPLVVEEAEKGEGAQAGLIALRLSFVGDRGAVTATDLWSALRKGSPFLFSKGGLIDLSDSRFQWLRQIPAVRVDRRRSTLRLTMIEFIRLSAMEPLECGEGKRGREAERFLSELSSLSPPDEPLLEGLESQLREYQRVGVRWLWFLYHHGLSGLLCDDMGLGKTHQSMALLIASANRFSASSPEEKPYYLIVCPTSVIYHWKEKLQQFLPTLRLLVHYGPSRSLEGLHRYDIVLTSYGIVRSDREKLASIPFEVAIYDEIQVAKNHNSQTYASLEKIEARMRLGLTGTPIENNLRELKSLFDLVLPGYLPGESRFREEYINPIERLNDPARKALLRRVIHPFVMRRKKEEVLTELPDKVEEKMFCELSPEQRRLYEEVLKPQRDRLLSDLESGEEIPYLHIFALLSALKQVCDHPALFLKETGQYKQRESGKWELFVDLVTQARESGQKVVVFSHYLGMLDIIENYLRDSAIGYAAIRGKTVRRDEELRRFATDPTCELFVGSLQAVGLGIDLTAASVVIHYDRWWNAARERQATDRVYRIGQRRGVQVFKLLTLGTLEEGIDKMIERKGELMEEVVRSDDQGQIKQFSCEELAQLLSWPN